MSAPDRDDVLADWAAGALNDEAAADALDIRLAADPAAAARAVAMREAAALAAQPLAEPPPAFLRGRVLARALHERPSGRPAGGGEGLTPIATYAAGVDRLATLLEALPGGAWARPADPYRWTVHGLVAHLLAVERYFGAVIGVPGATWEGPDADHLAMTEPTVAAEAARSPAETSASWRDAAGRALSRVRALDPGAPVRFCGIDLTVASLLVVRAFELWTHADDIRRAAGLPTQDPAPAELRTMSDTAVRSLPGMALLAGLDLPPARVRIVLTGAGGGTWDVAVGAYDPVTAEEVRRGPERAAIVADVAAYCRVAARRIDVDRVAVSVTGDRGLARTLLVAAQAIAV